MGSPIIVPPIQIWNTAQSFVSGKAPLAAGSQTKGSGDKEQGSTQPSVVTSYTWSAGHSNVGTGGASAASRASQK